MKKFNVVKMNKTAAAVYAVGVWSFIGWFGYKQFTGRSEDRNITYSQKNVENDPRVEVYQSKYFKTVIIRKEPSVPIGTELSNFLQRWFGGGDK